MAIKTTAYATLYDKKDGSGDSSSEQALTGNTTDRVSYTFSASQIPNGVGVMILTAYDNAGKAVMYGVPFSNATSAAFTSGTGWITPVTDRTEDDVRAIENLNRQLELGAKDISSWEFEDEALYYNGKGTLNFADLNRIECDIKYMATQMGYFSTYLLIDDFSISRTHTSIYSYKEMQRIVDALQVFKTHYFDVNFPNHDLVFPTQLTTYTGLNRAERIIKALYETWYGYPGYEDWEA